MDPSGAHGGRLRGARERARPGTVPHQDPYGSHQDPYGSHQDPYGSHQDPYGSPPGALRFRSTTPTGPRPRPPKVPPVPPPLSAALEREVPPYRRAPPP
ncbi:protein of unknown function [Streptomyces murinus]